MTISRRCPQDFGDFDHQDKDFEEFSSFEANSFGQEGPKQIDADWQERGRQEEGFPG